MIFLCQYFSSDTDIFFSRNAVSLMSLTPGEKEGENKCGKEALGPINVKARKSRGTKVQSQMLHGAVARHVLSQRAQLGVP